MNRRSLFLALAALAFAPLPALAGGKAGDKVSLTFHLQSDGNDNPKMVFPERVANKNLFFRRLSEVNEKDIEAFAPFPASDGATYGLMIQLKGGGQRRLSATTATSQDRWLLTRLNGRSIDVVMIDRQIDDGKLVVWKGVTALEIQQLDKIARRIGEAKKR